MKDGGQHFKLGIISNAKGGQLLLDFVAAIVTPQCSTTARERFWEQFFFYSQHAVYSI